MVTKKNMEEIKGEVPTFTKEQILAASKYANYKDAFSVILSEGETYTLEESDRKLEKFLKGKVN